MNKSATLIDPKLKSVANITIKINTSNNKNSQIKMLKIKEKLVSTIKITKLCNNGK